MRRQLLLFSLLVGCGGGAGQEDAGADAGAMDAGTHHDGGAHHDAGARDAGSRDAATGTDGGARIDGGGATSLGLRVEGNRILLPDGSPFHGRGANLHDTRSCDACTYDDAGADEVIRRMDVLTDDWGANFLRLALESYGDDGGFRNTWQNALADSAYLADIHRIVEHATAKPSVYVLMSIWQDPTLDSLGWPTDSTRDLWRLLAREFANDPKVLFGLVNEPEDNFDGAQDAACWAAMNQTVQAIRDVEDELGVPHHVITVQGTGDWARRLDYYVTHPITAGGGDQIAYEVHVYDPESSFADEWIGPAATLPVIIGEHGPIDGSMTVADCVALEEQAEAHGVPWLAWTFHQNCSPNLIVDNSGDNGCGVGMPIVATSWGDVVRARLATPW